MYSILKEEYIWFKIINVNVWIINLTTYYIINKSESILSIDLHHVVYMLKYHIGDVFWISIKV